MHITDMTVKSLPAPERGQTTYADETLAGFGVRVSQGGTKSFVLVHGRQRKRVTLGRYPIISLSQAREKAKVILAEQTLGALATSKVTFETAKAAFLKVCEQKNRPRTVKDYGRLLNRHFCFGRTLLKDIVRLEISEKLDKLTKTPAEQNFAFRVVRHFFRFTVEKGYLAVNPIAGMKAPAKLKKRKRVLTDEELVAVWQAAEQTEGPFGAIVRLLILTGQRRGEIGALRRAFYSHNQQTVTLPDELTKNHREHTFPVGPATSKLLGAWISHDVDLLFPGRLSPETPFNGWSKCKESLDKLSGVTGWRLHDLHLTRQSSLPRTNHKPFAMRT